MVKNIIFILCACLQISLVLFFDDYRDLGVFYFYMLFAFLLSNIAINKSITLLDVWNFSFLFIILSEVFSESFYVTNNHLQALKYLIIANNLINIGYFSNRKSLFRKDGIIKKDIFLYKKYISTLIILFISIYFLFNIERVVYTFSVGRNLAYSENVDDGSTNFLGPFISALGLVLPAIITYYFSFVKEKRILISILYSFPIFLILFLGGTRFPLLFSFLGLFIVAQAKISTKFSIKKSVIVVFSLGLLLFSTDLMKHYRSTSTKDLEYTVFKAENKSKDIPAFVTSFMSAEGVIDMSSLMFSYFETHDYLYGESTLFITYFWVPRSIWPEKPTMLGHWLLRESRSNFGDAHSASFGFTGFLYSDFGPLSLVFIFFIGRLIKAAEDFKNRAFKNKGYSIILGAMLFPYIFLFVRSPITASINFLGILLLYYLFKRLIISK
jgi:oligosaccharide repeat unit polymerase